MKARDLVNFIKNNKLYGYDFTVNFQVGQNQEEACDIQLENLIVDIDTKEIIVDAIQY